MKTSNSQICADAGTKYCPCHLAYSGDCIKCPIIRGGKTCDCSWQGVCVYNELKQNRNVSLCERQEYLCKIKEINDLGDDTFLIKINVAEKIILDLCSPGAYVMIKSKDKSKEIFNTPISVMDVDSKNCILEVVIKPRGVKTKNIINYEEVWLKGPYFNGIFGIKQIKSTHKTNAVVVLSGLSQVNSINIVKRLVENNNNVDVFINNKGTILESVMDKLMDIGVNIYNINFDEDENFLRDYIKRNNVELVYSGGSNSFSKYIMDIVDSIDDSIKLAISNNNLICCGEGICGACTVNVNGQRMKSCKAQIDSRAFLNSKSI